MSDYKALKQTYIYLIGQLSPKLAANSNIKIINELNEIYNKLKFKSLDDITFDSIKCLICNHLEYDFLNQNKYIPIFEYYNYYRYKIKTNNIEQKRILKLYPPNYIYSSLFSLNNIFMFTNLIFSDCVNYYVYKYSSNKLYNLYLYRVKS